MTAMTIPPTVTGPVARVRYRLRRSMMVLLSLLPITWGRGRDASRDVVAWHAACAIGAGIAGVIAMREMPYNASQYNFCGKGKNDVQSTHIDNSLLKGWSDYGTGIIRISVWVYRGGDRCGGRRLRAFP